MVKFPADETGRLHKLLHLWHGLYRIFAINGLNISVSIVYYHQDGGIQAITNHISNLSHQTFSCRVLLVQGKEERTRLSRWNKLLLITNKMKKTNTEEE